MNTNYLFFDIETIPNQSIEKPIFDKTTVKLGNVKDPIKIADKLEKEETAFNNGLTKTMSLSGELCQVLSIGYILTNDIFEEIESGVIYGHEDDAELLKRFNRTLNTYLQQYNTYPTLVGWNTKGFDIPVLWKRGIITGERVFSKYMDLCNKYSYSSIDLMHVWNNFGMGKLTKCCNALGIDAKTGLDGSMIYDAWKDKRIDDIKEYNLQDCQACVDIAKRIL